MSTTPDEILLEAEEAMTKATEYLQSELRGIRTGRASTALVEYVKVDYYGSPTDLKSLAAISVIENAGLGLNPQIEAKMVRITIPSLDANRRKQLVSQAKKHGEEQKVVLRNTRRDANKLADGLAKQEGTHYPEDEIETLKSEIQELLKKYEAEIDAMVKKKSEEITEV